EMGSGRGEEITAVEGPRNAFERILGIRKFMDGVDAAEPIGSGDEWAVRRAHEKATVAASQRQGTARAANAGIDYRKVNSNRHVSGCVRKHQRALEHLLRRNPVRDVDDLHLRGDRLDHSVAGPHEV